MGDIVDTIFGGGAGQAADAQLEGLEKSLQATEAARFQALQAMEPRFQQAGDVRRGGYQAGFDVQGQMQPIQAALTQAGNVQAQQQLAGGAQQATAAILGGAPLDFNALAPQQLSYNPAAFGTPNVNDSLSGSGGYNVPAPDIGVPSPTPGVPVPTVPPSTPGSGGGDPGSGTGNEQLPRDGIGSQVDDAIAEYLASLGLGGGQTPIAPPPPTYNPAPPMSSGGGGYLPPMSGGPAIAPPNYAPVAPPPPSYAPPQMSSLMSPMNYQSRWTPRKG